MTTEQIKELQQGIGTAAWKLGLDKFAEAIGSSPEHHYAQGKFKDFTALSRALSAFAPETLLKLIEAGRR